MLSFFPRGVLDKILNLRQFLRVFLPAQTAGRPKAALLFWFFGDFRYGALLFMVILVIYQYRLVGCFGFNGPLRQYFSLYRAVSQREGERGEKG